MIIVRKPSIDPAYIKKLIIRYRLPNIIIIIEGLLVLWDEKPKNSLSLKGFVDCRSDERMVRRIKRNMKWGQSFEQITYVYLDMARFRHDQYVEPTKWSADIIVNGSCNTDIVCDMITDYIV